MRGQLHRQNPKIVHGERAAIRLMLIDDQVIVRQGLRALLQQGSNLIVVAEAGHGHSALSLLAALMNTAAAPEIVLVDVRLPQLSGLEITRQIVRQFPQLAVLLLTTFDDDEHILEALRSGACGYLLKDTPARELIEVLRLVHRGYNPLSPGILQKLLARLPVPLKLPTGISSLTLREQEVLGLIARGASNQEIARALYITEGTVKYHVTNILGRLHLRNRTEAAIFANSHPDWRVG